MNIKLLFTILFTSCCFNNFSAIAQAAKIIFDTDMESDVDDIGALAMLHSLADNGEAEILGTMVSSLNPWSVPTVDVINTYFQRADIPIGAVKTLGVYRNSRFAKIISEEFPQNIGLGEDAPDAVALYREILNRQPDKSVVIVTVGYLSNLSNLLKSTPDDISSLTGVELVDQKVKHVVIMGGRYPYSQDPAKWGNFKPDPDATTYVAKNWPTTIIFTGGGDFSRLFPTGKKTLNFEATSNPVSRAYQIYLKGTGQTRHSADLIAVYIAVRGWEDFFKINTQGYNHIFEDGTLMWRLQPDNPRHQYINYLKDEVSPEQVTEVFDNLIIQSIPSKATD